MDKPWQPTPMQWNVLRLAEQGRPTMDRGLHVSARSLAERELITVVVEDSEYRRFELTERGRLLLERRRARST